MQFSSSLLVLVSSLLCVSAAPQAQTTQLTPSQLDFFNKVLGGSIPKLNQQVSEKTKPMDPMAKVISKTLKPPVKIEVDSTCTGPVEINFSITDLTGISQIQVGALKFTGGDQSVADTSVYNLGIEGSLAPATLQAKVSGTATIACATTKSFPFSGKVSGTALTAGISGMSNMKIAEKTTINSFKVDKIDGNFDKINVNIDQMPPVLNAALDHVIQDVTSTFKAQAIGILGGIIKPKVQSVIDSKLPMALP